MNRLKPILPWLIGLVIIIPAILPFFNPNLFRTHDYTHVTRLAELNLTLRSGAIPPRWSKNLGFGYGEPIFSFYAPLPYYVGVGIHAAGVSYVTSVQLLYCLSFFLSFVVMYYLAREFWKPAGAYLCALLYIYVPYRAVDVYVRGALGELYGILFTTILLFSITKLVKTPSRKWRLFTALSVAGLLLSHNLMALIGLPLAILYLGWLTWFNPPRLPRIGAGIVSLMVGGLIASYFVVPAFLEKGYTSVDQLTQGGGDYRSHFVYIKQLLNSNWGYGGSIAGPMDGVSFELGKIHLALAVLSLIVGIVFWKRFSRFQRSGLLFLWLVFAGSILMMSFHSGPIWEALPLLKYLQFPWRLLMVPMIAMPLLTGSLGERLPRWTLVPLTGVIIWFYLPIYRPEQPALSNSLYRTDAEYTQAVMSTVLPDYIHPAMARLVMSQTKDISLPSTRFSIEPTNTPFSIIQDQPQSFQVKVASTGSFRLIANIFDFPGWQWYINDKAVPHETGTSLPVMSVSVDQSDPATYTISGRLTETPIRRTADILSIAGITLLGLLIWL